MSRSLRWTVALTVLLIGTTIFVPWWNAARTDAYERRVAAATVPVPSHIVQTRFFTKGPDHVMVAWFDGAGQPHETVVEVNDATGLTVGQGFGLWSAPGSTEVYAVGYRVHAPTEDLMIGTVAAILMAWLPLVLLARLLLWWRASRAAGQPLRMSLHRGLPTSAGPVGARQVWIQLTDGRRDWYQRVMWEPWLAELTEDSYRVKARRWRAGRGAALVTMDDDRRLYWSGPARSRGPRWFESLEPGPPSPGGSRWSFVAVVAAINLIWIPWGGVATAAIVTAYGAGLLTIYGASPVFVNLPRRWRRAG